MNVSYYRWTVPSFHVLGRPCKNMTETISAPFYLFNWFKEWKSINSHIINVNIKKSKFENGFDPLVNKVRYYPANQRWTQLEEQKGLAKRKYTSHARRVFNSWLTGKIGDKGKSGKQSPFFYENLRKHNICKHSFGECLIGSANKTKSGFKVRFLNKKGSDGYVHHVAILANSSCEQPIHHEAVIGAISSRKTETNALTISHLCGNGGCARPGHYKVERKKINDERTHCHFLLRRAKSSDDARAIRRACPHKPKCFVNYYIGIKAYF